MKKYVFLFNTQRCRTKCSVGNSMVGNDLDFCFLRPLGLHLSTANCSRAKFPVNHEEKSWFAKVSLSPNSLLRLFTEAGSRACATSRGCQCKTLQSCSCRVQTTAATSNTSGRGRESNGRNRLVSCDGDTYCFPVQPEPRGSRAYHWFNQRGQIPHK